MLYVVLKRVSAKTVGALGAILVHYWKVRGVRQLLISTRLSDVSQKGQSVKTKLQKFGADH